MFTYAYKFKNKFKLEEEDTGILFLLDFRSCCSSRLRKNS